MTGGSGVGVTVGGAGVGVKVGVEAGRTVLRALAVGLGVAVFVGTGDGVRLAVGAGAAVFSASAVGSAMEVGSAAGGLQAARTSTLKATAASSDAIRIVIKAFSYHSQDSPDKVLEFGSLVSPPVVQSTCKRGAKRVLARPGSCGFCHKADLKVSCS